jgi:hypothetical protein
MLLLVFGVFLSCSKESADPTKNLKEIDLLGTWQLQQPSMVTIHNDAGALVFEGELYNPYTFTANGRFEVNEYSPMPPISKGDYEFDLSSSEIHFYQDDIVVTVEDREYLLQERSHFMTWLIQSFENNQLTITIRSWGRTFEGEIIEDEDIEDVVYVKVE